MQDIIYSCLNETTPQMHGLHAYCITYVLPYVSVAPCAYVAICICCHIMHMLPYTCIAISMYCHMHVLRHMLPYPCVAICMCCHMHVLPYACVAIYACVNAICMYCHMHVLPYACVASYAYVTICMYCHMHVLPFFYVPAEAQS